MECLDFGPGLFIFRGLRTVTTIRYSLFLLMNKEDKPCVGVPEDEDHEFDECQQEFIIHQVWEENIFSLFMVSCLAEEGSELQSSLAFKL